MDIYFSTITSKASYLIFLISLLSFSACNFHKDKVTEDDLTATSIDLTEAKLDYSLMRVMVFRKCVKCHDGRDSDAPDLRTYPQVMDNLQDIQDDIRSNDMPKKGNPQLTECEKQLLFLWIEGGAAEISDQRVPSMSACGN